MQCHCFLVYVNLTNKLLLFNPLWSVKDTIENALFNRCKKKKPVDHVRNLELSSVLRILIALYYRVKSWLEFQSIKQAPSEF